MDLGGIKWTPRCNSALGDQDALSSGRRPSVPVAELYRFMQRRERARVRKELMGLPAAQWRLAALRRG